MPQKHLGHRLEKKGPGFRSDFSEEFIEEFAEWLSRNYRVGIHGNPCGREDKSVARIKKKRGTRGVGDCNRCVFSQALNHQVKIANRKSEIAVGVKP
jgi:hypothetical protein